jgi:hypothetical protein
MVPGSRPVIAKYNSVMRFTSLFITFSIALTCFAPPAVLAVENRGGTRQVVFPRQFSLGTLFSYELGPDDRGLPESPEVFRIPSAQIGPAQGLVKVPAKGLLYLRASYQLVEHPEILTQVDPNLISCISFNRMGIVQPLDRVIEPVSHLTGLRRLDLQYAEMPDDVLKPLKDLTRLEALDLDQCGLKGTFLKDLSPLTNLQVLYLSDCKLVPGAYGYIARFHKLRVLNLVRTGANDASLSEIAKLQDLEELLLDNAKITPKGLLQLLALKKMQTLELTQVNLRAADLLCLAPMKLKNLYLPHQYSAKDYLMLRRAMPATSLMLQHGKEDKEMNGLFAPTK